jgi:hypothetical protein
MWRGLLCALFRLLVRLADVVQIQSLLQKVRKSGRTFADGILPAGGIAFIRIPWNDLKSRQMVRPARSSSRATSREWTCIHSGIANPAFWAQHACRRNALQHSQGAWSLARRLALRWRNRSLLNPTNWRIRMQIKAQVAAQVVHLAARKPKTLMGDAAISARVKLQPRKPKTLLGDSATSARVKLQPRKPKTLMGDAAISARVKLQPRKPKTLLGDSATSARVKLQPRKPKTMMGDSAIAARVKLQPR